MKLSVLALLLSLSLVSAQDYKTFKTLHTYNKNFNFDCNEFMNRVLKNLKLPCKVVNTVILGDKEDFTAVSDVVYICQGGGIPIGHGVIQSKKTFRTATCRQLGSGGFPPDCKYKRYDATKTINVICQNYQPVHLEKDSHINLEQKPEL